MNALDHFRRISRILWVRSLAIGLLAVLATVITPFVGPLVPEQLAKLVDADGVNRVLDSLVTALLTVTTFSVSVMVAVRNAATTRWTPRYLKLLAKDPITQNVLATFIGTYIFSLTAIILSNTEPFTRGGYAIIFGMTIITITLVVVAIIRWVDHLQEVGSLTSTAAHLQKFIGGYLKGKRVAPCWGARNLSRDKAPRRSLGRELRASAPGYVSYLDLKKLQTLAQKADVKIVIDRQPGDYVRAGESIGYFVGDLRPEAIFRHIDITMERTFNQDVRFGLRVIADIAVKAMSPGVNDPQTAVEIVERLDAIVPDLDMDERQSSNPPMFTNIWIKPIRTETLLASAFEPIIRYGGAYYEVQAAVVDTLSYYKSNGSEPVSKASARLLRNVVHSAANDLQLPKDRDSLAGLFQDTA